MLEFDLYQDDHFVTFDIVDTNYDKNEITLAVSDAGKITIQTFDLHTKADRLYFEYGVTFEKVYLDEFEEIKH